MSETALAAERLPHERVCASFHLPASPLYLPCNCARADVLAALAAAEARIAELKRSSPADIEAAGFSVINHARSKHPASGTLYCVWSFCREAEMADDDAEEFDAIADSDAEALDAIRAQLRERGLLPAATLEARAEAGGNAQREDEQHGQ